MPRNSNNFWKNRVTNSGSALFYRADKSRNRLTRGAVIGLTITKVIVKAHKGKTQVQSRVDEGTEFIISISK